MRIITSRFLLGCLFALWVGVSCSFATTFTRNAWVGKTLYDYPPMRAYVAASGGNDNNRLLKLFHTCERDSNWNWLCSDLPNMGPLLSRYGSINHESYRIIAPMTRIYNETGSQRKDINTAGLYDSPYNTEPYNTFYVENIKNASNTYKITPNISDWRHGGEALSFYTTWKDPGSNTCSIIYDCSFVMGYALLERFSGTIKLRDGPALCQPNLILSKGGRFLGWTIGNNTEPQDTYTCQGNETVVAMAKWDNPPDSSYTNNFNYWATFRYNDQNLYTVRLLISSDNTARILAPVAIDGANNPSGCTPNGKWIGPRRNLQANGTPAFITTESVYSGPDNPMIFVADFDCPSVTQTCTIRYICDETTGVAKTNTSYPIRGGHLENLTSDAVNVCSYNPGATKIPIYWSIKGKLYPGNSFFTCAPGETIQAVAQWYEEGSAEYEMFKNMIP